MRNAIVLQSVLIVAVAVSGLTGCKKFGQRKPGMGGATPETGVPPLGGGGGDVIVGSRPELAGGELPRGQFTPVYFDFDSAKIRPSEVSKLEVVATHLRSSAGKLVIEGHTDERGTAEYNRALGERRASAAREELLRLGVDANRISTISYGKDRPSDLGHDEAAWTKNRRCEFAVVRQ